MSADEIHLGYFENFKANDTVLIEGDNEGLRQLADVLRSLGTGSIDLVEIDRLPFVRAHQGVRVIARRTLRDLVERVPASSNAFTWERNEAGWQNAANRVEALIGCQSGHHYLDAPNDQVMVEVAKGENGNDWWTRHG